MKWGKMSVLSEALSISCVYEDLFYANCVCMCAAFHTFKALRVILVLGFISFCISQLIIILFVPILAGRGSGD